MKIQKYIVKKDDFIHTHDFLNRIKIAIVADMHDKNANHVITTLEKEKPDLILVPGDLMERRVTGEMTCDGVPSQWTEEKMNEWQGKKTDKFLKIYRLLFQRWDTRKNEEYISSTDEKNRYEDSDAYHFIRQSVGIAPVVYCSGNHEWYHTPEDMTLFEKNNIFFVDNRDIRLVVKGRKLLIGGLPTRYNIDWLKEFSARPIQNELKILLMHHPEYYDKYVQKCDDFDLIVSGHAHGGQIRFGGIPLYAPGQGLFPKYTKGRYPSRGFFVVSAGCSNTIHLPRLGNPGEVVILEI